MKFKIPFKTITMNLMYVTWTPRGRKIPMRIKSKEAKKMAEEVKQIVLNSPTEIINGELEVVIDIYSNWYNLDKTIKKRDIANLEKFITDSIFSNLEQMDDSQIFKITMNKIQSDQEFSIIDIKQYENNNKSSSI